MNHNWEFESIMEMIFNQTLLRKKDHSLVVTMCCSHYKVFTDKESPTHMIFVALHWSHIQHRLLLALSTLYDSNSKHWNAKRKSLNVRRLPFYASTIRCAILPFCPRHVTMWKSRNFCRTCIMMVLYPRPVVFEKWSGTLCTLWLQV